MAGTYFKYAERNVDSQINWAEIGKNMVNMLQEEDRLREEKKAAIDEASREFGEILANAPTGDFTSANEWILQYSSDASEALLMQDRLLKNGLLKPKDYTIMRQNLNDGTNQMFQVAKEYQAQASEAMKRYKAGESQDLEAWLMEQVQGLSNFKNTKAYINPTNFSVSLGMMKKKIIDGKEVMVMDDNPDNYFSVNQLRNRMNTKYDRYDYVASVDRQVNALGENQISDISRLTGFYKVGSIKEITDPTMRERLSDEDKKTVTAYQEWENNMISSELSNPYHATSLLTNAVDKVPGTQDYYEPTFDAELAKTNPKYILVEDDGSGMVKPKLTPEQEKVAADFLRAQTRNALDRKTTQRTFTEPQPPQPPQPTEASITRMEQQREQAVVANTWNSIFTAGSVEEKRKKLNALLGVNMVKQNGLYNIDITDPADDGSFELNFVYPADPSRNRTVKIDNNTTLADWAAIGSEVTGIADVNQALSLGGGGDPAQVINTQSFKGGVSAGRGQTDYGSSFNTFLLDAFAPIGTDNSNYTASTASKINLYKDASIVIAQMKRIIPKELGLDIRSAGGDNIRIQMPGAPSATIEVKLFKETNQEAAINNIIGYITRYADKDKVAELGKNLGWTPSKTTGSSSAAIISPNTVPPNLRQ